MQLVQYFRSFSTQVQSEFIVAIEPTQNVLLHVAYDMCLAKVVERNLTETGKKSSDRATLATCCADE